jgi:NAD dependent epimerase/dehydratase family enzyme
MLPAFRVGAGGVVGGGMQWVSWIGIDDVLGAIHHALVTDTVAGPLNVVAPHPVTNRELTGTLAAVLRRPAWLPVPAAGVRLALGAVADETVLASADVVAGALLASGYRFRTPDLETTLRHLLGR